MLIVLPFLAVVGAGLVALGWKASGDAMHPAPAPVGAGLADYPELHAEDVTVLSRTGVHLAGRFFQGTSGATVVLTHGYGGRQDELLPVAAGLHRAGLGVFTYDLRGCGKSGGGVTFGALEQEDLRSVVDYLQSRPDVDANRIGAYGFSMGGASTLLAAAADERIRAVVADSAWSAAAHWLKPSLRAGLLHPNDRFSPLSLKLAELRARIDLDSLRPSQTAGAIAPRPLLLIHGTADHVVPVGDAHENAAAAGPTAEVWLVEGVGHGGTIGRAGAAASARVGDFFLEAL